MREARVLIGIVSLILVVLGVRISAAQIDSRMPEGPNRALVARLCTTCHDLGHLVSTGGRMYIAPAPYSADADEVTIDLKKVGGKGKTSVTISKQSPYSPRSAPAPSTSSGNPRR